ncbi:hypothetical protein [Kineococcus sp. SYSU DK002]|uniref:hypothetical protein n=1 Tax=Kineococcus sp. SYSU DK002 TaxID=3383123 RepID=UPI003D7D1B3B
MDFFPDPPPPSDAEPDEGYQPAWHGAPDDVLPGVVPVELVLGRSDSTVVLLTGVRAFPEGLAMSLGVRVRGPLPPGRDLHAEVFDGPYPHDAGEQWRAARLKWGFEFSDGRRATNVDPPVWGPGDGRPWDDRTWRPDRPVLTGQGGGGSRRSVDRDQWLWPLPPPGRLRVVLQWPQQGIATTTHDLDAQPFLDAAARARPVWDDPGR